MMSPQQPKRCQVITLGPLNPPLAEALEQFPICNDYYLVENKWIKEEDFKSENKPEPSFRKTVDYVKIFINESVMFDPNVLESISHYSQLSFVHLYCCCDDLDQETWDLDAWPDGWSPNIGPGGIIIEPYTAKQFNSLKKQMPFLPMPEKIPVPEYYGQVARDKDPFYAQARAVVLQQRRRSISLITRHCRIGYRHATRLLEAMEDDIQSASESWGGSNPIVDMK